MSESVCYLNEARNGDIDAAFHGLIELSDDAILALQEAYPRSDMRAISPPSRPDRPILVDDHGG
jgi:hypothetical protein